MILHQSNMLLQVPHNMYLVSEAHEAHECV